jgi:hypothetical protein
VIRRIDRHSVLEAVILTNYPYDGERLWCGQHIPYGYLCTRPRGHDGPHVAHGSKNIAVCMWDDADTIQEVE